MDLVWVNLTHDILKKKYRELSLRYHPDKNPTGGMAFVNMKNAYDYLNEFFDYLNEPKPNNEPKPKKERKPIMCSWCCEVGSHNRRSCPKKNQEEAVLKVQLSEQIKIVENENNKLEALKEQLKKFE